MPPVTPDLLLLLLLVLAVMYTDADPACSQTSGVASRVSRIVIVLSGYSEWIVLLTLTISGLARRRMTRVCLWPCAEIFQ